MAIFFTYSTLNTFTNSLTDGRWNTMSQNLTITQQNKGRILRFHTIRACTKKHENTHIDRGKTWLKIWHVKDASKKGLRACGGFSPRKIEKKTSKNVKCHSTKTFNYWVLGCVFFQVKKLSYCMLSTGHCALNSWKSFKEVMHLNFTVFHCKPIWSWWNTKN